MIAISYFALRLSRQAFFRICIACPVPQYHVYCCFEPQTRTPKNSGLNLPATLARVPFYMGVKDVIMLFQLNHPSKYEHMLDNDQPTRVCSLIEFMQQASQISNMAYRSQKPKSSMRRKRQEYLNTSHQFSPTHSYMQANRSQFCFKVEVATAAREFFMTPQQSGEKCRMQHSEIQQGNPNPFQE